MGRRCFLMLLAVLLISWCLSGCSAERPESQENGRAEPEEENVSSEAVLSAAGSASASEPQQNENTGKMEVINYRVTDNVYYQGNISLRYPQITGLQDIALEESCNTWIEQAVMQRVTENTDIAYELNYEVTTSTPELLSIVIKGYWHAPENAYPQSVRYTLNIDIDRNQVLRLSDLADPETLAGRVVAGEDLGITGDVNEADARGYLSALSADTLAEEFAAYDFSGENGAPDGYCYIQSGRLHVLIPTVHALGDYLDVMVGTIP